MLLAAGYYIQLLSIIRGKYNFILLTHRVLLNFTILELISFCPYCNISTSSETEGSIATLQESVSALLHCLETAGNKLSNCVSWEVEEGIRCACFLRRIYEEVRHYIYRFFLLSLRM